MICVGRITSHQHTEQIPYHPRRGAQDDSYPGRCQYGGLQAPETDQLCRSIGGINLSRRQSFRSISLGNFSTDDHAKHDTALQSLAAFLLDWEEIEGLTIEMPDDMNASENCDTGDYFWWGRVLAAPIRSLCARPLGRGAPRSSENL